MNACTGKRVSAMRTGGVSGFTMLELLTVMVIMVVVMTMGIASYFNIRRGAEMRGAVSAVRTTLSLARQHAVMRRKETIVVFRQTPSNLYYQVFEKAGKVMDLYGNGFIDNAGVWSPDEHVGKLICNMSSGVDGGGIGTVLANGPGGAANIPGNGLRLVLPGLDQGNWGVEDEYGWCVHESAKLSAGVRFCTEGFTSDQAPAPVRFYSSGRSDVAWKCYMRETLASDSAGKVQNAIITVFGLTGLSTVEMGAM